MLKRKVAALVLAISAALSLTATTNAEDTIEQRETVRIGNYECWVENGEYYTELDGEVCRVVNFDVTSELASPTISRAAGVEIDWSNEVDISDGRTYHGSINIENSDDFTPVFCGNPTNSAASYKISAGFIFPNKYSVMVHTYETISNSWTPSKKKDIEFSWFTPTIVVVSGTPSRYTTKCCMYFYKEGSTGEKTMNYSFRQIST